MPAFLFSQLRLQVLAHMRRRGYSLLTEANNQEQGEMRNNEVAGIMAEAEKVAKSRTTRSFCGNYELEVFGIKFNVRDAGGLLWTRDGKRISRKKAEQQIKDLLR